ncbi:MAG: hypothetical protein ACK464_09710, partial [Bacteroidota bacterium]
GNNQLFVYKNNDADISETQIRSLDTAGVIVEQSPTAEEDVKTDRVIYVIVNATSRPRVGMPKLTDCSLNLAKALIKNAGLVLGTVSREYAEYGNNLVTAQRVGGRSIEAGEKVLKGTVVDITIIDSEMSPNNDSTSMIDPVQGEAEDE